jgi:hypothetical protein
MTRTASVDITLPEESEVRAPVQGPREPAAHLATNFKVERNQASERAMGELAKQAQELKLGYE